MNDTHFLDDLKARHNTGERLKFIYFWDHQANKSGVTAACFSQWYEAPYVINEERFATAEHFMMAQKAALFEDADARTKIMLAQNPGAVKALGRGIRSFNESIWVANRFEIVVRANTAKFDQHPELGEFLRQTGKRVLVEASPVDRIWGIGLAQGDERASDPNHWNGLNLLGFALMQARDRTKRIESRQ